MGGGGHQRLPKQDSLEVGPGVECKLHTAGACGHSGRAVSGGVAPRKCHRWQTPWGLCPREVKRSRRDHCKDHQSLGSLEFSTGSRWGQGLGMDRPKFHVWLQPQRKGIKETAVQHDDGLDDAI